MLKYLGGWGKEMGIDGKSISGYLLRKRDAILWIW